MEIFKRAIFVYFICFAAILLVTASEANWVLTWPSVISSAFIAIGPPVGLAIAWTIKAGPKKSKIKNSKNGMKSNSIKKKK